LQQHLGDWHDLEVMEQMMTEMIGKPAFLREHVDIGVNVMNLMVRNRALKKRYQGAYLRMASDGGGYPGIKEWASHLLASPSAFLKG